MNTEVEKATKPYWAIDKTFLQTYMGFDIYVSQEGKFSAKLPGRDPMDRSDLKSVQAEIDKLGKSVPMMRVDTRWGPLFSVDVRKSPRMIPVTITEIKSDSGVGHYGRRQNPYISRVRTTEGKWQDYSSEDVLYHRDEELERRFDALGEEQDAALQAIADDAKAKAAKVLAEYNAKREELLVGLTVMTKESFRQAKR